jgi:uncharacterized protein
MKISQKLIDQLVKAPSQYADGRGKTITFCVTEDCNMRCKYCYLVGMGENKKKLTKEQADKNIAFIFDNPQFFSDDVVIWEFIGGEPFIEIEIIDYMCDLLKLQMYEKRQDWFENYMFSFSTNGTLYHKSAVRSFIEKNPYHVSVGFSVDGLKELHDKNRVYKDGHGSFDDVIKNIELYKKDFSQVGTKSTLSHESLPYVFESVKFLSSLALDINMNVVFEDVWQEGDDEIFYDQLIKTADWLIETGKWRTQYVSLFSTYILRRSLNEPKQLTNNNWCGSGKMLHISTDGKLYPCTRFAPYSMQYRKDGFDVGDINNGYNYEKLEAFLNLTMVDQSSPECIDCDFDSGCAWCTGWNYDRFGSIFKRATFICKMHKARVLANEYYYEKLEKLYGASSDKG